MLSRSVLSITVLALAALPAAGQDAPQQPNPEIAPRLAFENEEVQVSGVTPGGQVVIFGVAREIENYYVTLVRREEQLADEDGDGAVSYALGAEVPPQSIWAAVDLSTGEYDLAAPGDYPLREIPFPGNALKAGPGDLADALAPEGLLFETLLVRPTVGAWTKTAGNGGESDEDGENDAQVTFSLDRLEPMADAPVPPAKLQPGDVLVVVDSDRMQFFAARFAAPAN